MPKAPYCEHYDYESKDGAAYGCKTDQSVNDLGCKLAGFVREKHRGEPVRKPASVALRSGAGRDRATDSVRATKYGPRPSSLPY